MTGLPPIPSELREGEQVEFKQTWTDRALDDLAAFANTRGGNLFIGIRDDGEVIGIPSADAEMRRIASKVYDMLGIAPQIAWQSRGGKTVLVVCVEASDRLVPVSGRYFVRVGSTNREMPQHEVARRMLQQLGSTWDALPCDATSEEIDPNALHRFARLVKEIARGRLPYLDLDPPTVSTLDRLGVMRGAQVTHAAILLFGRNPQRFFRSARIRVARVHDGEILNENEVSGTLFDQQEEIFRILRGTYVDVRFEIPSEDSVEGVAQRQEVWEIPAAALREAIMNALVHRDYTRTGDVQIRIYEDRMEIWNPGPLPHDLTPALLKVDPHPSRRRNELLAEVFYAAGLIERWGTGTLRMVRACQERSLPEPEFVDNDGGGFKVIFRKDRFSPDHLTRLGLSRRQVQAILHLRGRSTFSNSDYQQLAAVEKRTASRDLADLVMRGILERVGATGRGAKYRVKP